STGFEDRGIRRSESSVPEPAERTLQHASATLRARRQDRIFVRGTNRRLRGRSSSVIARRRQPLPWPVRACYQIVTAIQNESAAFPYSNSSRAALADPTVIAGVGATHLSYPIQKM